MNIPLRQLLFNKKFLIILAIVTAALGLFLINQKEDIDIPPEGDGIILDYSSSAVLINDEELLDSLDSLQSYDFLRKDIFAFGKSQYEPYKTGSKKTIGFAIEKKSIAKNGSNVSFEGKFGSSPNKINITVKLLRSFRLKVSIIDTKTGSNIDSELPSNTKLNQFIGSLPYETANYSIVYSDTKYKVVVRLNSFSSALQNEALEYIRSAVDNDFINDNNINIFYTTIDPISGRSETTKSYIASPSYEDYYSEED